MNNFKTILLSLFIVFYVSSPLRADNICEEDFLVQEHEITKYIQKVASLLEYDTKNSRCRLKLATLYLKSDQIALGFETLQQAYHQDNAYVKSKNISKLLDLAMECTNLKEKAIKNNSAKSWMQLGDIFYEMGAFQDAAKAYESVMKLANENTKYMILLALSYGNINEIAKSEELLYKVVQLEPYNFYGNYYLGKLYKNVLDKQKKAQMYLMMAKYLIKYDTPKFDTQEEYDFLYKDLDDELREEESSFFR